MGGIEQWEALLRLQAYIVTQVYIILRILLESCDNIWCNIADFLPIIVKWNLLVNSFELQELVDVVDEGEEDSEDDVAKTLPTTGLNEMIKV